METTRNATETLYLYQCAKGIHRIYRETQKNNAPCSRCEAPSEMKLIASVPREEGESLGVFHGRVLDYRPGRQKP